MEEEVIIEPVVLDYYLTETWSMWLAFRHFATESTSPHYLVSSFTLSANDFWDKATSITIHEIMREIQTLDASVLRNNWSQNIQSLG